jgi:hypothetical protein
MKKYLFLILVILTYPSRIPHLATQAYDTIPDRAPSSHEGEIALDNQHDAVFEQMVCADYVDLRGDPDLGQLPIAYVKYGDVVCIHERWGEWAFIDGWYWIQLKYLCDF